jgi:hypothetical protein
VAEVVLLAAAEAEAFSIYANHEERRAGRGEIFSHELDHVLELLREFPDWRQFMRHPFTD